jgi:reverse transcriptase-like protein/integrase-like protein/chromodomain-containing protein
MSSSNTATLEYLTLHHPPVLTSGELSPRVVMEFEQSCLDYFANAKGGVTDELQVIRILPSFQDQLVRDWIAADRPRLSKLSFKEFIDELRKAFLPRNWEDRLRAQILTERLRPNIRFLTWATSLQTQNCVLRGTTSHLSDSRLRDQIEAGVDEELRLAARKSKAHEATSMRDFLDIYELCDAERKVAHKQFRNIIADENRNKRNNKENHSNSYHPYNQPSSSRNNNSNTPRRPPKLTEEEKEIIRKHDGCWKCRHIFLPKEHDSNKCAFPAGENYVALSADFVAKAKRILGTRTFTDNGFFPAKKANKPTPAKPIASVTFASPPASSASIIEADSSGSTDDNFVAALFGPVPGTSVIGNGSFSDGDASVSPPLKSKHFIWNCTVDGPAAEFPLKFATLIDNGAHMVLIRPDAVSQLGLPLFELPEPESVDVAISSSSTVPKILTHYVKLRTTSIDGQWTSRLIFAIVAPGLCMPIILGLPFLTHNSIICDHEIRSCVHKKSGYNLLDPVPVPPPKPPRIKLKQQLINNRRLKAAVLKELVSVVAEKWLPKRGPDEVVKPINIIASIRNRISSIISLEILKRKEEKLMNEFKSTFEPPPHCDNLPSDVLARIRLKNPDKHIKSRNYPCPRKFKDSWGTLIQQHLKAGIIRPSSSSFASPAFIIPKADPTVLPRWVNDYRQLNENTITDSHPLPRIDDILNDCAKGKIWATIDMTNSFFQTRMHPDDVHLTAVNTPFGLFEWLVMPMGLKNAPSIHQRRMLSALRPFIGKICHIYIDDIVIWSNNMQEHEENVRKILQALKDASLYCNPKKSHLFCSDIKFLGHLISEKGIEADPAKTERIKEWPVPHSATQVRAFLGLVRYISAFLPNLAEHTAILTELTFSDCDKKFPPWLPRHQNAFDAIKNLVLSRECLTTIDYTKMPDYKIFLTTDASDFRSGAVLSFGTSWESARPVAFDSMTFKAAELNYPVHEKEMLAIIRALKRWRSDLIGVPFYIFTDHKTLENFHNQKDLSRRQARWMEFISQYDGKIVYVKGEDNSVADALSRLPDNSYTTTPSSSSAELSSTHAYHSPHHSGVIASILSTNSIHPMEAASSLCATGFEEFSSSGSSLSISTDESLLQQIRAGYEHDPFVSSLRAAAPGMKNIIHRDGFWFIGQRLVIPKVTAIREALFELAHDSLGHFGTDKSYAALRNAYYWPNMRKELENSYVPSCTECQRNKSSTAKPIGPLHPLPIPEQRGDSVAIDFIGPLPKDGDFDSIVTFTDRLGSDIQIVPTHFNLTAERLAELFFDKWYCENGLPLEIISDRDKLFMSSFWKSLHKLTGVKLKMSTAYHPETDGSSERSNKTIIQSIRFHVERNQKGWVRALPRIRFNIMNSVNKSTGFSPFQLRMGRSPRLIPPLLPPSANAFTDNKMISARTIIDRLVHDVWEAQDNLLKAKISQARQSNKFRLGTFPFEVGQRVRLSTLHRRRAYKSKDNKRVVKFMPRFDGPHKIIKIDPEHSTVTLELPPTHNIFPVFHTSEVLPFIENDETLFPSRTLHAPEPVMVNDELEHQVDKIIDEKKARGRGGSKYLVRWVGQGPEFDLWLPRKELENNAALDIWLASRNH